MQGQHEKLNLKPNLESKEILKFQEACLPSYPYILQNIPCQVSSHPIEIESVARIIARLDRSICKFFKLASS